MRPARDRQRQNSMSARPSSSEQAAVAASDRAEALRVEGNALFRDGDYAAAETRYAEAIKLDAQNARAHTNRGMARKALGSFRGLLGS